MIRAMLALFSKCCPHCRSIEFRIVGTRNGFEKALQGILQPCRCCLCGHHFFRLRWQTPL